MTGFEAFKALRDGKKVRRIMWTAGCYIVAIMTEDDEVTIKAHGTDRFRLDIQSFPNMVLEQLLEYGFQWEVVE